MLKMYSDKDPYNNIILHIMNPYMNNVLFKVISYWILKKCYIEFIPFDKNRFYVLQTCSNLIFWNVSKN